LTGLSPSIDASSVQVKGKGNFIILSVNHKLNYLNQNEKPKDITRLEDSIKVLNTRAKILGGMVGVYNNEESMILANKAIGNKEVGVDALDLAEVANLFRKRLMEISEKRIAVQEEAAEVRLEINKLNKQLATRNGKRKRATGEITVVVSAKERTPAKFNISYFVNGAGWTPSYDIRSEGVSKPITMDYKAKVFQTSGIDWNNIKLTLSTLNPKRSGTQPTLRPWTLQYRTYAPSYRSGGARGYSKAKAPAAAYDEVVETVAILAEDKEAESAAQYTAVTENTTSVEFKISLPYSIPTDGQMHDVSIAQHELPVTFKHFAVPKLDLDAFLLAEVTGWEEYKMLSGNANIYFEGTYVGKSYINTKTTDDTLDLSFGRDQSVNITREKLKDFTSKKFLGDNIKETYAFEISVRNTKKVPIKIKVEDQIPKSSNKEIQFEVEEISGASHNKVSGKLSWELSLAGGETKKLKLIYSVKYPKGKVIGNL
ncbi:MAG: DUF4139 domain-containing protein, partial [Flavobacteriales bacterium]|nr:DUF4139 domain-containing protein [Flavobacteriales bacterium]